MAPNTVQRTALEKYHRPNAGAVIEGVAFDFKKKGYTLFSLGF
jgi:hypothetical protein